MKRNTFYVSCPIDVYGGYPSRSRDLVKALIELDRFDVKIIPQRWGNLNWGFLDDHFEDWGFLKKYITGEVIREKPDYFMQITTPNEFQPMGKFSLGVTAGIETSICDPSWIEGINRMDLTLVSSQHAKDVFLKTSYEKKDKKTNQSHGVLKVEKPIDILFEGINIERYKPISEKNLKFKDIFIDINSIPEKFCFLFVGHWLPGEYGHDRKNVGVLIKYFYETFKNHKSPPALILKTSASSSSYTDRREVLKKIKVIKDSLPKDVTLPNVYLLHGELIDEEINELYNHPKIKAMINLTRGEGFGRPLLEFSLVNKPIITSGWSGHLDFLNPEYSLLLPGKLEQLHPSSVVPKLLLPESSWFKPDVFAIGFSLKEIFNNYDKWLENAKKQGFHNRNHFNYGKMKEKLNTLIDTFPTIAIDVPLNLPKLKKL